METRIQKWGNSLALRIPKPFALEVGLAVDSPVQIEVVEGRLSIVPIHQLIPSLEQLVAGISDENRHGEIESGDALGSEVW